MIRFLADEDFDARIVRGLRLYLPDVDVTSINELRLKGTPDPEVLQMAIEQDRVLLTHDKRTMVPLADQLTESGSSHPGVIYVNRFSQMGTILDHLATVAGASHENEWRNQVKFVPF